jgi:hypothetical protein
LYTAGKDAQPQSQVVDENPTPGVYTYDTLKRIKMPLILDVINKIPWTPENVLMAMDEKIKNLARKYGGRRAFFQTVDAESIGQQAVLDALYTDKGLAWFAGHCYERVEAAIRRASAQKPFVPKSKRGGDGTRDSPGGCRDGEVRR